MNEDAMRAFVPDLQVVMLPDTGHWTQQERPGEVNEVLVEFCRRHASS
jgi:pimeloyl-ACP methyl ester carboxylesterase